ncbi:hydroxysteroid dehydrogenase-like protein 1 [Musca autumnalis]|uniref:hydroxysteroid dehydrogenase-like protein 1 n=1 Tax=Musca autumnalis TaxID=221902 RepID=UPI003CF3A9B1
MSWYSQFFLSLGFATFLCYLYECLRSPIQLLYNQWLERNKKLVPLTERYGKWAAITGSTDGIGRAYARELARIGFNIVLIARNEERLKQTANEIEKEFGVEVFTVNADFSQGPGIYEKLFQELDKRPIRLMVNNVGIGHNPPGIISTFKARNLWDMIYVNIAAATQLSRHFIDLWLKQKVPGCLVNVSSVLELQPCVYGSVYGASKAYLQSFTLALQHEVAAFDIDVQLLSPGGVQTKINGYSSWVRKGNLWIPSAEEYAKWAVNTLGKSNTSTGYFWHGIQATILKCFPVRLRCVFVKLFASTMADDTTFMNEADIRRRYGHL